MRSLSLPLQHPRAQSAFLGVERSARGLKWIERLAPQDAHIAAAIAQRHNLPEIIGRILAARGVSLDDVADVLNPTLRALCPDPSTFTDMDKAAKRIARAIETGERIAIFGDYDVDGASSSALMKRFLAWHGLDARIYIPDRITEGYGPNGPAITQLIEDGAQLILTVDCGSTSFEALDVAAKRGIDVVVVDHHQVNEELPAAYAVVNPNRQDCLSAQGHLCAAGVTFLLCVAAQRRLRAKGAYTKSAAPDLLGWLDIVALATVCDVVPLSGVNRAFVVQGLKVLRNRRNPGLRALADAAGVNKPPSPYTLGFVLGPRINAGGRIGDASLGARLLASEDEIETRRIAETLDRLNRERREIEIKTVEEAAAWADRTLMEDPSAPIIIAGSPAWHKGLVGLAASRLTERFQRPCLIFSQDEEAGESTGSARSVSGVDIGAAVRGAVEAGVAKKGGGHTMAAGITVDTARLHELAAFLRAALDPAYRVASAAPELPIDGVLRPRAATLDFCAQLEAAGPYGQGNPAPRFSLASVRPTMIKEISGGHLRLALQDMDGSQISAVAFRAAETEIGAALAAGRDLACHVAGRIERDEWGGKSRIEFHIEDVAPANAR
ncbi:single-stranded-DNA-specific exonuclease RecJ [Rhodomicrobium lacus]|uniref:single-stranded-DNA-specific exonuclease RecJ n=1 Tax=Rhodomicrobium lacus TaxID=2498452 RepID=UPI0026E43AC2|nr:single-stranded-DNA-specific exonuclease RecJ [Rhodomicrobium lacus]WKW49410.1 single-stranded-DNA-specific exonuclease RecJ [Rhodomicrobium lacus]